MQDKVRHLLDALARGRGGCLFVHGEPGIGVTAVLDAVAALAGHRRVPVRRAAGDEYVGRLGGVVGSLLGLPPGPDMVEQAIDAIDARSDAGADAGHSGGAVVLVVDDAHHADVPSLRALCAVARRTARAPVVLVVGAHHAADGRLGPLHDAVERSGGAVIPLPPLPDEAVAALVHDLHGAPAGASLLGALAGTGGNPLLVVELLDELARSGALVTVDGHLEVRGDVAPVPDVAARAARRARLVLPLPAVLDAAAVLADGFGVTEVAAVAGVGEADAVTAVAAALDAGVFAARGTVLGFRHALVRDAVAAAIPGAIAVVLHRRAAEVFEQRTDPRRLRHLLAASDPALPADAERLLAAAAGAVTSTPALAIAAARAVLAAGALDDRRAEVQRVLGDALLADGDVRGALEMARASAWAIGDEAALRLLAQAAAVAGDLHGDPLAVIEAVAAVPADDPDVHRYRAQVAMVLLLRGELEECRAAVEDLPSQLDDPVAAGFRDVCAAWLLGLAGRPADGLAIAADVAGRDHALVGMCQPHLVVAVLGDAAGDPAATHEALGAAAVHAARDHPWARPMVHAAAAVHAYRCGRLDDALAEVAAGRLLAADTGTVLGGAWLAAVAALVQVLQGQPAAAAAEVAAGMDAIVDTPGQLGGDWLLWADGVVKGASGDVAGGRASLELVVDAASALGVHSVVLGAGLAAARLAAADGDRSVAARQVAALAAAHLDGAPAMTAAESALTGLATGDAAASLRAADRYDTARQPLHAADARADAARALLAAGDRGAARRAAVAAVDAYEQAGALGAAATLRAAMADLRLPAPTARRPLTGWDSLTPTELAVVRRLGEGSTNAAIAEALGVSRRTVESHLVRVYAKLGLDTRAALVAAAARRYGSGQP